MRPGWRIAAAVWLLLCPAYAWGQTAAGAGPFEVATINPGGNGAPARVMITNRETSRRHFISVNSTLGRLDTAHIRGDHERVVLICENGFAVVDPRGRTPADEVYASGAVASPGARWIAFRRFYPPTHPGPSDAVAIYDTAQSSEQNHEAYPAAAERAWHAGWPVYPPASEWKDASAVTPPGEAHELSSILNWLGDPADPVLAFTVRRADRDTLVLVDPSQRPPAVCAQPLPGPADRWRVKTIAISRAPGGRREVRVASRALAGDAPSAAFPVPAAGCR